MEPTAENIRAFEAAHKARAEPVELPGVVQRTLGDLKGKRVLHLHCGTGEATATLAELGAVVTGVDARPAALETARERWPKILWVDGNPQELPRRLVVRAATMAAALVDDSVGAAPRYARSGRPCPYASAPHVSAG